jgi:hypothetical protein
MAAANVTTHLARLWRSADEAAGLLAATAVQGLAATDGDRLLVATGRDLDGLRHLALRARGDRRAVDRLATTLGLGELAAAQVRLTVSVGSSSPPALPAVAVPAQVAAFRAAAPGIAVGFVATLVARGAVATDDARFVEAASQLADTARLLASDPPTLPAWHAQLLAAVDTLLAATGAVPDAVARCVAPTGGGLLVARLDPTREPGHVQRTVAGLDAAALLASRRGGRWAVPAERAEVSDRLVAWIVPPNLRGPLRAATGDRGAAISGLADPEVVT